VKPKPPQFSGSLARSEQYPEGPLQSPTRPSGAAQKKGAVY
jgi:hypothetical protein